MTQPRAGTVLYDQVNDRILVYMGGLGPPVFKPETGLYVKGEFDKTCNISNFHNYVDFGPSDWRRLNWVKLGML